MQGLILLDKPENITSFGAVARIKRLAGEKRVGHTGTLDPMATGVLPVLLGKATALSGLLLDADKRYTAAVKLGVTTDTDDITGNIITENRVAVTTEQLQNVLCAFRGKIMQKPPIYSALKKDGVRLYKLARQGVEIEREPRRVTVDSLTLGETVGENAYELLVGCSKGLYVRTLIADIGEALGCGAAMSGLRRLRAGVFSIEDAITLEQAAELAQTGRLAASARSADILFSGLPELRLTARGETVIRHGALWRTALPDGGCRLYGPDGTFLGLGAVEGGQVRIQKSFY